MVVTGGNPYNMPEFVEGMQKWSIILRLYDMSRNPRYGHLEHLPAEGGLLDQPCLTMEALQICVMAYQEKMSKDMERMSKGVRH